jgi:3-phenylpropionate/trans-cinnamate dioxygenase ferredoxin reductase component
MQERYTQSGCSNTQFHYSRQPRRETLISRPTLELVWQRRAHGVRWTAESTPVPISDAYAGEVKSKTGSAPRSVTIVGAGDCGARVALGLRDLEFSGTITLIGDEPGDPYERPTLSKGALSDGTSAPTIATDERLAERGITRITAQAITLNGSTRSIGLADGTTIRGDRVVLATGARARRPPIGVAHVHTLRSSADAASIHEMLHSGARAVVVGGGFVGLEVAAAASQRGCSVTVVEFAHRLMTRVVPSRVSAALLATHEAAGTNVRTGVAVSSIQPTGKDLVVTLSDGSQIKADVIVAGLGAIPNTDLAASGGLTLDNGIAVDDRLRTSAAGIFAGGDCCSFPHRLYGGRRVRLEAWRSAVDHADTIARNIVGQDVAYDRVPWFWSDQFDVQLQVAGLHDEADTEVLRLLKDGTEVWFGVDTNGRVVSASGFSRGTGLGRTIGLAERLIAAELTPSASELADPSVDLRSLLRSTQAV